MSIVADSTAFFVCPSLRWSYHSVILNPHLMSATRPGHCRSTTNIWPSNNIRPSNQHLVQPYNHWLYALIVLIMVNCHNIRQSFSSRFKPKCRKVSFVQSRLYIKRGIILKLSYALSSSIKKIHWLGLKPNAWIEFKAECCIGTFHLRGYYKM